MMPKPSRPDRPTSRRNGPPIAPRRASIAPARAYRFPSLSLPFSFIYLGGYPSVRSPPAIGPPPGDSQVGTDQELMRIILI
jgi:hypothetical protein